MPARPIILVNPPPLGTLESPALDRLAATGFHVIRNQTGVTLTPAELRRGIAQADAVIAGLESYTAEVLQAAPRLRIIARFGVGTDNVDLEAARARELPVTVTPGANTQSVADVTLAMITATCCSLWPNHQEVVAGGWRKHKFPGLHGRTLGIVGLGRIGRAVMARALAFGMRVITHDPLSTDAASAVPLAELITQSDVITLHVPQTGAPLLDAAAIAAMKRGAIVVNAARGGLIDEDALAAALKSGHLGGAALDVFAVEPLAQSPLRDAPNVIFSPHIAGVSASATEAMAAMCVDAVIARLTGHEIAAECIVTAA